LGGLVVPDFDTILQAQLRLLVYVAQSEARGQDLDPFINQAIRAIKAAIEAKLPTGMAEMDGEHCLDRRSGPGTHMPSPTPVGTSG
jgi:hypothetical protein